MAQGPGHEFATGRLEDFLRASAPPRWHVRNQAPVTLATSEPEPDLSVARGSRGDYRGRHPRAVDLALVVEVADTSLAIDRLKGRTYGGAGIPEYWIVDLAERRVESHRDPADQEESGYRTRAVLGPEDELRLVIEGETRGAIRVAELLP